MFVGERLTQCSLQENAEISSTKRSKQERGGQAQATDEGEECLGLSPSSATYILWDLRQVNGFCDFHFLHM